MLELPPRESASQIFRGCGSSRGTLRQAAATQKKPPTAQEMAQRVAISRAECAAKNRESVARGRSSTVLATPIRSVRVNVPRVALLPQGAASAAKATPLRAPRSTPVPDSVRACLGKASTLRARVEKAKKQQIMPGMHKGTTAKESLLALRVVRFRKNFERKLEARAAREALEERARELGALDEAGQQSPEESKED